MDSAFPSTCFMRCGGSYSYCLYEQFVFVGCECFPRRQPQCTCRNTSVSASVPLCHPTSCTAVYQGACQCLPGLAGAVCQTVGCVSRHPCLLLDNNRSASCNNIPGVPCELSQDGEFLLIEDSLNLNLQSDSVHSFSSLKILFV